MDDRTRLQQSGGFHVEGASVRTSNSREMSPHGQIKGLWQHYCESAAFSASETAFAVYSDYETDRDGDYTVTVGKASEAGIEVSAGTYLIFTSEGRSPEAIGNAWNRVWLYFSTCDTYIRTFKTDYEVYAPDGAVTLHIGVEHIAV